MSRIKRAPHRSAGGPKKERARRALLASPGVSQSQRQPSHSAQAQGAHDSQIDDGERGNGEDYMPDCEPSHPFQRQAAEDFGSEARSEDEEEVFTSASANELLVDVPLAYPFVSMMQYTKKAALQRKLEWLRERHNELEVEESRFVNRWCSADPAQYQGKVIAWQEKMKLCERKIHAAQYLLDPPDEEDLGSSEREQSSEVEDQSDGDAAQDFCPESGGDDKATYWQVNRGSQVVEIGRMSECLCTPS